MIYLCELHSTTVSSNYQQSEPTWTDGTIVLVLAGIIVFNIYSGEGMCMGDILTVATLMLTPRAQNPSTPLFEKDCNFMNPQKFYL